MGNHSFFCTLSFGPQFCLLIVLWSESTSVKRTRDFGLQCNLKLRESENSKIKWPLKLRRLRSMLRRGLFSKLVLRLERPLQRLKLKPHLAYQSELHVMLGPFVGRGNSITMKSLWRFQIELKTKGFCLEELWVLPILGVAK